MYIYTYMYIYIYIFVSFLCLFCYHSAHSAGPKCLPGEHPTWLIRGIVCPCPNASGVRHVSRSMFFDGLQILERRFVTCRATLGAQSEAKRFVGVISLIPQMPSVWPKVEIRTGQAKLAQVCHVLIRVFRFGDILLCNIYTYIHLYIYIYMYTVVYLP